MWSWLKERMCYVTYNSIIKKALPYVEAFKRVLVENAYVHLPIPSCSLIGFSAIGKVLRSPSGILLLVCNGEECLRSSSDAFLLA